MAFFNTIKAINEVASNITKEDPAKKLIGLLNDVKEGKNRMSPVSSGDENKNDIVEKKSVSEDVIMVANSGDYEALVAKRDAKLAELAEIEEECEGIDNKANADKVRQLNFDKVKMSAEKDDLENKVKVFEIQLTEIENEITKLSVAGVNRILEAIGKQRWYFFENYKYAFMDKMTGYLWGNLDVLPSYEGGTRGYCSSDGDTALKNVVNEIKDKKFASWSFPTIQDFMQFWCEDTPFRTNDRSMKDIYCWFCKKDMEVSLGEFNTGNWSEGGMIPICKQLVEGRNFTAIMASGEQSYTDKEKRQMVLNLFVENDLVPKFDDAEITKIFKKIYVEKPKLVKELQVLEQAIEKLKHVEIIGADFDYVPLLADYDMEAVNGSVIKYYQAVQKWIDMLMDKVEKYESQNADLLNDFNALSVQLANKYQDSDKLTEEENKLLAERQEFLYKKLNLGMNEVKNKLLVLRKEADTLEDRLETIDEGSNPLRELAELEREPRPSFEFVTENSAKILKNALNKLEYFKGHRDLFKAMIAINKECADEYLDFKTSDYEALRNLAEKSKIKENIWQGWQDEWQELRIQVEKLYLSLFTYALEHEFATMNKEDGKKINVFGTLIDAIKKYGEGIGDFYLKNRKALYQKNFNAVSGEFVEKVQLQQEIFEYTKELQQSLQKIIFSCENSEDRIFILRWANGILNLQVDAIIGSVKDKFADKVNNEILDKLLELRQRNLEVFLNDAKAYADSCKAREDEFNDLIFQMQQGLE